MSTNWNEVDSVKITSHALVYQVITVDDRCYYIISEDGKPEEGQEHFETFEEAVNAANSEDYQ